MRPAEAGQDGFRAAGDAPTTVPQIDPIRVMSQSLTDKRRLLLLVRTGLTLGIGYLLLFSTPGAASTGLHLGFAVLYLASNVAIAILPAGLLASAAFDVGLVLTDTAATSFALYLIPQTDADVFVFYFAIIFLASITDRLVLSMLAPAVASGAYLLYLISRYDVGAILQPSVLLRVPFFLLAGAFYGFLVDRVRRGQAAAVAAGQRAQARTEYLSLITHDLKQPLWVAQQSASLLYDRLGSRPTNEHALIAHIMVSLRRMQTLSGNFLDFDRIESRGVRVVQRPAPLNLMLEDLIDAARPAIELKRLEARLDLAPDLPLAHIDPPQIERALANLIDNAIKFTPEGGAIMCRTRVDGSWITLSIADSGPGITPERAATLFTRFQHGTDASGRRSTGLGLHIARAIILAHGGDIAVDTSQARGACFAVRLPVATAEAAADLRPVVPPRDERRAPATLAPAQPSP